MSSKFFQLKSFFTYWLDAVDEHSLHSPFLFDFFTKVLRNEFSDPTLDSIERIRKNLEQDHRIIHVTDYGSGSGNMKKPSRKISDIARTSITPPKYSKLYARILRHYHCTNIVDLGTSLGVNTLYLATSNPATNVTTFEGSPETASFARRLFQENGAPEIQLIEGNIDDTLPAFLESVEKIDLALIDANHRFEPTLNYVDLLLTKIHPNSIVVLDDIHYSPEMERAWHVVQGHERVHTSIDLYRCGLIFFNPSLTKQNAVLQF